MKLGALDVDDFRLGGQEVDAVYLGDELVWSGGIDYGFVEFETAGEDTFVVPEGVSRIRVTVVGAGGAGLAAPSNAAGWWGGGSAGAVAVFNMDVSAGQNIPLSIGAGAPANDVASNTQYEHGEPTTFGDVFLSGGYSGVYLIGADTNVFYKGYGKIMSNLAGSFVDGNSNGDNPFVLGGQASIQDGQDGELGSSTVATNEGVRGGGSGAFLSSATNGQGAKGGDGYIKVEWGFDDDGSIGLFEAGIYTVDIPAGREEIAVLAVGAGGGGGSSQYTSTGMGGYAGERFFGNINVSGRTSIDVTVGVGGAGGDGTNQMVDGEDGTDTIIHQLTLAGGVGGKVNEDIGYQGRGDSNSFAGLTLYDGILDGISGSGGEAGLASGMRGVSVSGITFVNDSCMGTGGSGAGGNASAGRKVGGKGGDGAVIIYPNHKLVSTEFTDAGSGEFTVPDGVNELILCMCGAGGGGAGGGITTFSNAWGGFAGETITIRIAVTEGQVIPYTIGAGGAGGVAPSDADGESGEDGGSTSFGDITVNGGNGATVFSSSDAYNAQGEEVNTCYGVAYDAELVTGWTRGGQGCFGDGGEAAPNASGVTDGDKGSGGAGGRPSATAGGDGVIKISWLERI